MVASTTILTILLHLLSSHNHPGVVATTTSSSSVVIRDSFYALVPQREETTKHTRSMLNMKPLSLVSSTTEKKSEELIMIRPLATRTKKGEEVATHASHQHELIRQAFRGKDGKRDLQTDPCESEIDGVASCIVSNPSCNFDCFGEFNSPSCSGLEDQLCSYIDNCGCSVCEAEFLTAYSCGNPCGTLRCDDATEAPSTTDDECDSLVDTASQCVSISNPPCADCMNAFVDELIANNPDVLLCLYLGHQLCTGFATCGCEACESDLLRFYECYFVCPSLSCRFTPTAPLPSAPSPVNPSSSAAPVAPSPTPNPPFVIETAEPTQSPRPPTSAPVEPPTMAPTPPCPDELSNARACAQTQGSCLSCIDDAVKAIVGDDGIASCANWVVGICSAIKTECDCGNCGQYVEDSCLIRDDCSATVSELDCNIQETTSPTVAPVTPTASPTKAPVTPSAPGAPEIETEPGVPTNVQPDPSPVGIIGDGSPLPSSTLGTVILFSLVVGSLISAVFILV